jgi:putative transposase
MLPGAKPELIIERNHTAREHRSVTADEFDYIERFYNPKRRHSKIGYMVPMEFERQAD